MLKPQDHQTFFRLHYLNLDQQLIVLSIAGLGIPSFGLQIISSIIVHKFL